MIYDILYDIVTMGPIFVCGPITGGFGKSLQHYCHESNSLKSVVALSKYSLLYVFFLEIYKPFLGSKLSIPLFNCNSTRGCKQVRVDTLHCVRTQHYCSALWQISRTVVRQNSPDIKWGAGLRETQSKLCVNRHKIQFKIEAY